MFTSSSQSLILILTRQDNMHIIIVIRELISITFFLFMNYIYRFILKNKRKYYSVSDSILK